MLPSFLSETYQWARRRACIPVVSALGRQRREECPQVQGQLGVNTEPQVKPGLQSKTLLKSKEPKLKTPYNRTIVGNKQK